MDFYEKLNKGKGGYIFLSHSHDDIEKVRLIRNRLENIGFDPLCFFLKCLSDEDEIEDLIKREIDAREWFIFLNSENSRKSKWVTMEREYITHTNKKKIFTLDLDDPASIEKVIYGIAHNLRVFISYSQHDREIAERIKKKLEEKDYLVFIAPDCIPVGASFSEMILEAIREASQDGCVLALMSETSMNSEWVRHELNRAFEENGRIIPVLLGDTLVQDWAQYYFNKTKVYRVSENPKDEELDNIIESIGWNVVDKI